MILRSMILRFLILPIIFCCATVHAQLPELERGDVWRYDAPYGYAEVKVNGKHVKPQSPHFEYKPPKDKEDQIGLQGTSARGSVQVAEGSALGLSHIGSSIGSSTKTPMLVVGHGYSTMAIANGKQPTRSKAHASGASLHWVRFKHPGGQMNGSIKMSAEVDKKDSDFTGTFFGRLGANQLTAKYNTKRKGWDVTGTVNGQPVKREFGRTFTHEWPTTQQMAKDTWFTIRGSMNGGSGIDFLGYGLKTTADNFGTGSVPVRTDDAKMRVYVKVTQ